MTHPGGRVHRFPVGLVGWVTHPSDGVHGLPVGVWGDVPDSRGAVHSKRYEYKTLFSTSFWPEFSQIVMHPDLMDNIDVKLNKNYLFTYTFWRFLPLCSQKYIIFFGTGQHVPPKERKLFGLYPVYEKNSLSLQIRFFSVYFHTINNNFFFKKWNISKYTKQTYYL